MSDKITLEQSLKAYRVMNTPTEYSWKQHFAKVKFSNPDAMLITPEEKEQFYNRLTECTVTICDNYKMSEGPVRTLKDMLDIVTDPNNEKILKGNRKIVFSSSNGHRPIGKDAYNIWNGFQVIDLDIKDAAMAARLKNHIFQKLHTCNWFLGVGFSSSGKGLHVWTKICVPEEDDIRKKKLLYLANFRHKYSYVYLAILSAAELFNFTTDDILKWMDLMMSKPQQGGLLGYDAHPLINSSFFEDFIYVNFDNVQDIGQPGIDWVTYPDLKEVFKRWDWFDDGNGDDDNLKINVLDKQAPAPGEIVNKVHYKHFERWRLANTLVSLFDRPSAEDDKDNPNDTINSSDERMKYQNGYKYLRMICSNAIKDKELLADCITAARHRKPIDPWAVQRLNTQHGFKIKLKITDDSTDGENLLSNMETIDNPTLIRESPRRKDFHLTREQYLGDIRTDILKYTSGITLLEAGPGLGKTEMVKQLVRDGYKIVMVMPFTSTIKSKVENDDDWYFSYGNKKPKLDAAPGLAMTIDKFSYMNMMDIKTAGYDYIFIDESHLLFLSEYRPVMSKVIDLIKNSEVPIIMMSGTPCGELVFFPDATHIHIDKDDDRKKEFIVNLVDTPNDLMFHMCRSMAKDIANGYRILFPTNAGTLYSKQIEAAVNYFMRNDYQMFEPVKLMYYKKSNIGEQFMDDINFEKTIKDVQVLLCSNYLSVGVDILDKFKFSIYFADLILPHEIDQFCNRLRKNDLFAHLYVSKNDGEGNTRNLQKFKPLNFKLNDDELQNVHGILRMCNDMIERNPVEYKYNSLISSIIYGNKFIEYDNVENRYFLNETSYKVIQFERKYREYAQQLLVLSRGMEAYGYRVSSMELGKFTLEDVLFSNLKDMVKLAYDDGLQLNTTHIGELLDIITDENLKKYRDVIAGKYEIKKGTEWKDDIANSKMTVKNIEVFEKVIPIVISLSKRFEMADIKSIFEHCRNLSGTYNFAAIERIRGLVNIIYNDEQGRLDVPIKEFIQEVYKFSEPKECTIADYNAFIKDFGYRYAVKASSEAIPIQKARLTMESIEKSLDKIFRCIIKVSRPKKGKKYSLERAELLWKERSWNGIDSTNVDNFAINEFLDVAEEREKERESQKNEETN